MNPGRFRLMHLACIAAGGTGLVYGALRYFFVREGEYGPEIHAAQPLWQHLHVLAAPALVLMAGVFWAAHVQPCYAAGTKEGRRSGLVMTLSALPMIFSGYGIQVTVSEGWRLAWIWIHGITGVAWVLVYGAHWLVHMRVKTRVKKNA